MMDDGRWMMVVVVMDDGRWTMDDGRWMMDDVDDTDTIPIPIIPILPRHHSHLISRWQI